MKQCPICKREMKEQLHFCPFDGSPLIAGAKVDSIIGTIIDEKYSIDEKIGEGGMGKVYKATHIHMDHIVAIKILHPHLSSDHTALERFRREARATAYIRHPNAVTVSDFGVTKDSGIAYLVMELLEGIELREKIKEKHHLDYEETFLIVQQTCGALHAAHLKGIIHRDLKPDNIWLFKGEDGLEHVKVLDFGIAKLKASSEVSNLTQQGMIVGTPYYMSPEQCRGEELDARSDIYSMGIILYEMLTGQVPFQAPTPMGIVLKHANEAPKPPHVFREDLPAPIERVVLRALEKQKEDRQESAIQLAQELEAALYQAGIELKMLGTRTPQSFASLGAYSSLNSTQANPSPRETAETSRATPALAALATAVKGGDIEANTPPMFGAVSSQPKTYRQKISVILGMAILLGLVIAGYSLFRSKPQPTANSNAAAKEVTTTKPNDAKPAAPAVPEGMVLVPAGTFTMGYDGSDDPFERPAHKQTMEAFFIDVHEVTVGEYYDFMKAQNYRAPESWTEAWKGGNFTENERNLPVTGISWFDARQFAASLGKRLPTEKEWEYAARGTDNRLYPWGDEYDPILANLRETNKGKPMPVGRYPGGASPFGVMDMAGNVIEWTESDSFRYPGSTVSEADLKPGKIIRGGSFRASKVQAMVTTRFVLPTNEARPDLGFRCAKDAR
jgi:eukaryotic-like serine/threonine-protein kinase